MSFLPRQVHKGLELDTDHHLITVEEQTKLGVVSTCPAATKCASLIDAHASTSTIRPPRPFSAVRHGLPRTKHRFAPVAKQTPSVAKQTTPVAKQTTPVAKQTTPVEPQQPTREEQSLLPITSSVPKHLVLGNTQLSPLSSEGYGGGFSFRCQNTPGVPRVSNIGPNKATVHHQSPGNVPVYCGPSKFKNFNASKFIYCHLVRK